MFIWEDSVKSDEYDTHVTFTYTISFVLDIPSSCARTEVARGRTVLDFEYRQMAFFNKAKLKSFSGHKNNFV